MNAWDQMRSNSVDSKVPVQNLWKVVIEKLTSTPIPWGVKFSSTADLYAAMFPAIQSIWSLCNIMEIRASPFIEKKLLDDCGIIMPWITYFASEGRDQVLFAPIVSRFPYLSRRAFKKAGWTDGGTDLRLNHAIPLLHRIMELSLEKEGMSHLLVTPGFVKAAVCTWFTCVREIYEYPEYFTFGYDLLGFIATISQSLTEEQRSSIGLKNICQMLEEEHDFPVLVVRGLNHILQHESGTTSNISSPLQTTTWMLLQFASEYVNGTGKLRIRPAFHLLKAGIVPALADAIRSLVDLSFVPFNLTLGHTNPLRLDAIGHCLDRLRDALRLALVKKQFGWIAHALEHRLLISMQKVILLLRNPTPEILNEYDRNIVRWRTWIPDGVNDLLEIIWDSLKHGNYAVYSQVKRSIVLLKKFRFEVPTAGPVPEIDRLLGIYRGWLERSDGVIKMHKKFRYEELAPEEWACCDASTNVRNSVFLSSLLLILYHSVKDPSSPSARSSDVQHVFPSFTAPGLARRQIGQIIVEESASYYVKSGSLVSEVVGPIDADQSQLVFHCV